MSPIYLLLSSNNHGGKPLCVRNAGGKVHAFLIVWCVVCS